MSWINLSDVAYSALAGVFNKLNVVSGVISQSFTTAGATMIGQNLGAREYRRTVRILGTILAFVLSFALIGSLILFTWPDQVYGIFTKDTDVLEIAGVLTLPIILNFFGAATRSGAFSLINGSGRPKLNLMVAIIDGVIARVGLAALLGFYFKMGCQGFWLGDSLAGFIPFLIGLSFFLSGKWKDKKDRAPK